MEFYGDDMSYPDEAWVRLGRLLIARRVHINPAYRNRQVFITDTGLNERLVSDLEKARRNKFRDSTLDAIEQAYDIAPGSILAALQDPELAELPARAGSTRVMVGPVRAQARVPAVEIPPEVSLQDLDDWEQQIWLTAGLSVEERKIAIHMVRVVREVRGAYVDPEALDESIDMLGALVTELMKRRRPNRNGSRHAS